MPYFQKGNNSSNGKGGRPLGSRNRLCKAMLEDLAADWREGGAAAVKMMRIERPAEYVRVMCSILPKELLFENTATELDDDQLAELIGHIREQLLAASKPLQLTEMTEMKTITDGRTN
jgi:hypothetical protein